MKADDGRQPEAKEPYVHIKKIVDAPQVESGLKMKTHLKAGFGELVQINPTVTTLAVRPIALCG